MHPVNKETITKYAKLIADPILKQVWTAAMAKELYRLAYGRDGITKGTNTIKFLALDKITSIPKDRTVTYARIVVDHRPQKEEPQLRLHHGWQEPNRRPV